MRKHFVQIFIIIFLLGCGGKSSNSNTQDNSTSSYKSSDGERKKQYRRESDNDLSLDADEIAEKYPNDTYCAKVEYHNPNTGTSSAYTLTVEVESNEVTEINWPNGGKLDEDYFSGADLDDDGSTSFISDKGYEYDIQIIGKGGNCFANVPRARQCIGTTKNALRCRNMTDNPNRLCWEHQKQDNDNIDDNLLENNDTEENEENEDNRGSSVYLVE